MNSRQPRIGEGDSGGPLLIRSYGGDYAQIGVASADYKRPLTNTTEVVYVQIPPLLNWLRS